MKNHVSIALAVRRYCIGAAIFALGGCGVAPEGLTFRDQSAPIGVTSRYSDVRFAGTWHVRGAYPLDARLVEVERLTSAAGWELVTQTCEPNGKCEAVGTVWPATVDTPGADRLADLLGNAQRRVVVLWVDEGFRTAAVGDPSGQFAWVLDRAPSGGADRIKAARQVLEFSGFDLSAMEMRP